MFSDCVFIIRTLYSKKYNQNDKYQLFCWPIILFKNTFGKYIPCQERTGSRLNIKIVFPRYVDFDVLDKNLNMRIHIRVKRQLYIETAASFKIYIYNLPPFSSNATWTMKGILLMTMMMTFLHLALLCLYLVTRVLYVNNIQAHTLWNQVPFVIWGVLRLFLKYLYIWDPYQLAIQFLPLSLTCTRQNIHEIHCNCKTVLCNPVWRSW